MLIATADSASGSILLLTGQPLALRIRVLTSEGAISPADLDAALRIAPAVAPGSSLEAIAVHDAADARLQLSGSAPDTTSLTLRLLRGETEICATGAIEVHVARPDGRIRGASWHAPDGSMIHQEFDSWSSGPIFFEAGEATSIRIRFVDAQGRAVPEVEIPTGARIGWTVQPAEALRIAPMTGERFGFAFHALAAGRAEIRLALSVGGTLLHAGPMTDLQVVRPAQVGWTGFAAGTGPNRPVLDLALHADRLFAGGSFDHAGGVLAVGVAAWDGTSWTGPAPPFPRFERFYEEGGVLLAQSTRRDAVHELTGLEWTEFAPIPPGFSDAVLFDGAFTVTGPSMGVQAWQEGRWVQLADSVWDGDRLAAQRDRLWLGGTRRSGPMQLEVAFLRHLTASGWLSTFEIGCGENCDIRIDHLRAHGDDLLVTRSTGSPAGSFSITGRIRGGVREVVERDHWIEHSAVAAGKLFLANRTTVFVEEELGIREIGRVAGGEIRDLEGYEDALYVCGSFREIDGEEALYLARWEP